MDKTSGDTEKLKEIRKLEEINEAFMQKLRNIITPLIDKYYQLDLNKIKFEKKDFCNITTSVMMIQTFITLQWKLVREFDRGRILSDVKLELREFSRITRDINHHDIKMLHEHCAMLLPELAKLEEDLREEEQRVKALK